MNDYCAVFWLRRKQTLPHLFLLAQKVLGTPASSVYSERLFSEYGNIYESTRSRLLPKTSEKMLFLHHNYQIIASEERVRDARANVVVDVVPAPAVVSINLEVPEPLPPARMPAFDVRGTGAAANFQVKHKTSREQVPTMIATISAVKGKQKLKRKVEPSNTSFKFLQSKVYAPSSTSSSTASSSSNPSNLEVEDEDEE